MTARPLRKHAVLWTAAVVLMFVGYVAGAPIVAAFVMKHHPSAVPWLFVVYGPVDYYCRNQELPGSATYASYVEWCYVQLGIM